MYQKKKMADLQEHLDRIGADVEKLLAHGHITKAEEMVYQCDCLIALRNLQQAFDRNGKLSKHEKGDSTDGQARAKADADQRTEA